MKEFLVKAKQLFFNDSLVGYPVFNEKGDRAFIMFDYESKLYEVDIETVSRYTGYTDSDDFPIFENDIVNAYVGSDVIRLVVKSFYGHYVFEDMATHKLVNFYSYKLTMNTGETIFTARKWCDEQKYILPKNQKGKGKKICLY